MTVGYLTVSLPPHAACLAPIWIKSVSRPQSGSGKGQTVSGMYTVSVLLELNVVINPL